MGKQRRIDRNAVVELYKSGLSSAEIGAKMQCSRTIVNQILRESGARRLHTEKRTSRAVAGCESYDLEQINTCLNCYLPDCRSKSNMCPLQRRKIG